MQACELPAATRPGHPACGKHRTLLGLSISAQAARCSVAVRRDAPDNTRRSSSAPALLPRHVRTQSIGSNAPASQVWRDATRCRGEHRAVHRRRRRSCRASEAASFQLRPPRITQGPLWKRARSNQFSNVEVHAMAAGDCDGDATLTLPRHTNFGMFTLGEVRRRRKLLRSGQAHRRHCSRPKVDFIKMDIEGSRLGRCLAPIEHCPGLSQQYSLS